MTAERFIIDAQLHEPTVRLARSERDDETRRTVLSELVFAWTDAIGVDGVILFPTQDEEWAAGMCKEYPNRCATVFYVDTTASDPDEYVARMKARHAEGLVGLRILMPGPPSATDDDARAKLAACEPFLTAMERHGLPLFLWIARYPPAGAEVAGKYPGLTVIMDHLTLRQGPTEPRDSPPFRSLPQLLELAKYPNVNVKFSGAPALAEGEYPYRDLWPHLDQIVGAFGPERLMWGSDISRMMGRIGTRDLAAAPRPWPGQHTYAEALHYIRDTDHLSEDDKTMILGGTAQRVLGLNWT